jgi:CheY-like chemotaxis protein
MKKKLGCVLLIDDDEPTNYYNSLILEEAGCADHIEALQSGQKALEYLTNSYKNAGYVNDSPCPDLIFLDINMPAMNGWEFLDKYRELKRAHESNTILVMLTTSLFSEDVLKAMKIPEIAGFESKPLTTEIIDKIFKKYFVESLSANADEKQHAHTRFP